MATSLVVATPVEKVLRGQLSVGGDTSTRDLVMGLIPKDKQDMVMNGIFKVLRDDTIQQKYREGKITDDHLWQAVYDIATIGIESKKLWVYPARGGGIAVEPQDEAYIDLAKQNGITNIDVFVVYKNDLYEEWNENGVQNYKHTHYYVRTDKDFDKPGPNDKIEDNMRLVVCAWTEPNGVRRVKSYHINEMWKLRDKSKNKNGEINPSWKHWPERIVLSKAIKQTAKRHWPKDNSNLKEAIQISDYHDTPPEERQDRSGVIREIGVMPTKGKPQTGVVDVRQKEEPEQVEIQMEPNDDNGLDYNIKTLLEDGKSRSFNDIFDALEEKLEPAPKKKEIRASLSRLKEISVVAEDGGEWSIVE